MSILFPIIKQSFTKTISQDLVQVQPMKQPSGKLFYMGVVDEYYEKQRLLEERRIKIKKILEKSKVI
tara:strand:+ start:4709 stop:4909 length:201 start_codon:yes stop_codon:yes gene_type:complete